MLRINIRVSLLFMCVSLPILESKILPLAWQDLFGCLFFLAFFLVYFSIAMSVGVRLLGLLPITNMTRCKARCKMCNISLWDQLKIDPGHEEDKKLNISLKHGRCSPFV
mmetsp:Transcript_22359/g.32924  ORF Transcript_22359/g.32924 Transcript_22359/m.32924 type:complete len:109 (+) Transcript_22359:1324-1650(+)